MGNARRAGWYPDPSDAAWERYWDGEEWREGARARHSRGGRPATGTKTWPPAPDVLAVNTYVLSWLTLAVAVLAAVFAFVAMRAAFEAREAARSASFSGDASGAVADLETQLRDAGVLPPLEDG